MGVKEGLDIRYLHIGSLEGRLDSLGLDRRHLSVAQVAGDGNEKVAVNPLQVGELGDLIRTGGLGRCGSPFLFGGCFAAVGSSNGSNSV
jgi:hypothetical protein